MLEDDLVDSCKPGGRISVVGIYKAIPPRASGQIGGLFKAVVVGNSVCQLAKQADRSLTADDIRCDLHTLKDYVAAQCCAAATQLHPSFSKPNQRFTVWNMQIDWNAVRCSKLQAIF